jgi:hypothetical protein
MEAIADREGRGGEEQETATTSKYPEQLSTRKTRTCAPDYLL